MTEAMFARILPLRALTATPGWDSPRDKAIPPARWDAVEAFIERVGMSPDLITPCGDGTVHLRWSRLGHMADVEVDADWYSLTAYRGRMVIDQGEFELMRDAAYSVVALFREAKELSRGDCRK